MKKYKTLNNNICKEIVRLSLLTNEFKNIEEQYRRHAFTMLANTFTLLEDDVLCRLWTLVRKSLLPMVDRNRVPSYCYFRFIDYIQPILQKGGVFIE